MSWKNNKKTNPPKGVKVGSEMANYNHLFERMNKKELTLRGSKLFNVFRNGEDGKRYLLFKTLEFIYIQDKFGLLDSIFQINELGDILVDSVEKMGGKDVRPIIKTALTTFQEFLDSGVVLEGKRNIQCSISKMRDVLDSQQKILSS